MSLDIKTLSRLGGTGAGGYYALAERVTLAWSHEGYIQTEGGSRASIAELHRIIRDHGRSHVLVVATDRMRSQDAASRRVWRSELDPTLVVGVVFVRTSMLARAITAFVIGLARPEIPVEPVESFDEAIAAARRLLARGEGGSHG